MEVVQVLHLRRRKKEEGSRKCVCVNRVVMEVNIEDLIVRVK